MCVKLPATLNIQLECLLPLGKCAKFVGTINLSPSNYFSLSAAIKTVVSAY